MTSNALVSNRYILEQILGQGGMGAVYRASDLLTGETVALKRVAAQMDELQETPGMDGTDFRMVLTNEFRMLASLRHPNIITVLDYGFDPPTKPYFTMDLLEGAQTILAAGRVMAEESHLRLLLEMLQALAYLHRRGILHRDLKPGNILVGNDGAVKVLDFGLSLAGTYSMSHVQENTVGTLAYMAPELFSELAASVASDLYAVGVIACELLAGHHPYPSKNVALLVNNVLNNVPDLSGLEGEIAFVVERLLARNPEDRYGSAEEVIRAFYTASGQPVPEETEAVRESYLQAAQFVGRDSELSQLRDALRDAVAGKGSAWLIAGESGVGKSRLVDELRIRALVRGALVLPGQGIAEGSTPYQFWHEPLRRLLLYTEIDDSDAGVLKQIIPDIGNLVGREIADAPSLSGQDGQLRLLNAMADQFMQIGEPVVLILEDLHWAAKSLDMLKWLLDSVAGLPLLIVGTYRDDERPDLPDTLPEMKVINLRRLSEPAIAELSASILGESGCRPEILDFLQRETEGNVFFLIEIIRALAEQAGRLSEVGAAALPEHVLTGGVRQIIEHRLSRVPRSARALLRAAAIAGREIDLRLLPALSADAKIERWLTQCANAAVLERQEGQWAFAHDKLRQGILDSLPPSKRRRLHILVAQAIEQVYPNKPEQAAHLAHHWGAARDTEREARYSILAGDVAFDLNAAPEAIARYTRALEILKDTADNPTLIHLYTRLGRAQELSYQYPQALTTYKELEALGKDRGDRALELAALVAYTPLHLRYSAGSIYNPALGKPLTEYGLGLAAELKDQVAEIRLRWNQVLLAIYGGSFSGDSDEATASGERALELARELGLAEETGLLATDLIKVYSFRGRIDRVDSLLQEAQQIWRALGNLPMLAETLTSAQIAYSSVGEFGRAQAASEEGFRIYQSIGNWEGQISSRIGYPVILIERGDATAFFAIMEDLEKLLTGQAAGYTYFFTLYRARLCLAFGARVKGYELIQQLAAVIFDNPDMQNSPLYVVIQGAITAVLAEAHLANGRLAEAEDVFLRVPDDIPIADGLGFNAVPIPAIGGEIALARGNYQEAIRRLDKLLHHQDQRGFLMYRSDALYLKGKALLGLGKRGEGRAALDEALAVAEKVGVRRMLWKILFALSQLEAEDGHLSDAEALRVRAREVVHYIADHAGELRDAFLAQPDVRAVLGE